MDTTFSEGVFQHQWVKLPAEQRRKLVDIFKITRSEPSSIMGNTLLSDGHNNKDLQLVTREKMMEFLGLSQTTLGFYELWDLVLKQVDKREILSIEAQLDKIEKENIANWLIILKDLRNKARELNLEDKFLILVNEVFESIQEKTLEGTKKRGRPPVVHS
jgi:hypothetical protein